MTENTIAAQLEKISQGHYILKGQLNFKSVPVLWSKNRTLLFADEADTLNVDLAQLERSDSSGLALLVEWYREAELQDKKIIFYNLPSQMYDLARISGLNEILPLEKRAS
ncbi:MAG: STAS domain-containing protein [gamma proteobacterium symbiont of Lucinoma myriamae]|nr:STAS domain-containing protein [gamma proteobacterium symbiont of Lucinoma myriamae]MCU7819192.1 STAS domain-containing protein [gamma proteobacterium symbiont of Lucinoma myriamae]MCU7833010.1 STAS domain-containing protein [gamma proteobacterium symbiont of Lucinoma myriamae]